MDWPELESLSIPRISFIFEARLRAAVEELVHPKHVILAHTQGLLGGVRSKGAFCSLLHFFGILVCLRPCAIGPGYF